jgi:hypothetical protein
MFDTGDLGRLDGSQQGPTTQRSARLTHQTIVLVLKIRNFQRVTGTQQRMIARAQPRLAIQTVSVSLDPRDLLGLG